MKDYSTIEDVEVDGIDTRDYPDFSNAYISSACWPDGTELTEEELEDIPSDIVYDYVLSRIL